MRECRAIIEKVALYLVSRNRFRGLTLKIIGETVDDILRKRRYQCISQGILLPGMQDRGQES